MSVRFRLGMLQLGTPPGRSVHVLARRYGHGRRDSHGH